MFARTQWIESTKRYEGLFRDRPPALLAPFVERVPIVKGRWNPDKSTATSYAWFVWLARHDGPWRVFLIPPGCRARLTRPDDRARFAASTLAAAPLFDEAGGQPPLGAA